MLLIVLVELHLRTRCMEGSLGEMGSLKGSSPVKSCAVMAPTAHTSVAGSNLPLHASGARYLHMCTPACESIRGIDHSLLLCQLGTSLS